MRVALPPRIATAAFAARDPRGAIRDLGGETMGTRWAARFVCPAGVDAAAVEAAIVARLDGLVAQMSHWSPASVLGAYNRSPAGSWTILPPDFAQVMAHALAIAVATDGAFDPAIGRLVDAAGFGPTGAQPRPFDEAMRVSGWRRLRYTAADRRLHQPGGLALDLSGIAKGYAVDAVADVLAAAGIAHGLVEIGGELVGRGVRPDGQPWWVDLEAPPGLTLAPIRIALHGLAVATSGDYVRGAHTLDPRTGRAAASGVVSASVIHDSTMAADAWATALTVIGAHDGIALATREGLAARIVTAIDGVVRENLSPALAAMLAD